MAVEKQPRICFQVVSNWNIGRKPVYSAIFPANFRPNLSACKTAELHGRGLSGSISFDFVSWSTLETRDGFVQHYTPFGIPASGILLNPRVELSASL
jgi:hypothetical protein